MSDRFLLQKSHDLPDWWVVADKQNGVVIRFEEHRFNDTQRVTDLSDNPITDYMLLARVMREIGEWLYNNHKDIAL